jgi:hypothetical protein
MMKKYLIIFLYLSATQIITSQTGTVKFISGIDGSLIDFTSSNLPIVVINTNGQEIPNDEKITADMGIIFNGEGTRNYLTDPFNNYNGKIGIEIRGSSSQSFPKKQYAVETRDALGNDLDVSLLGFPEESDWILFAPYNDKSLMRDVITYKLVSEMGRYASRSKYCEVILNNEYVGIYVLLEKVKRDNNRVNIKKLEPTDINGDAITGGYIIKIDKWDGENNEGWNSSYLPYPQSQYPIYYQYHYPKPDEIVQQQKEYIQNKIFQYETIMNFSVNISDSITGYPKFLDVSSFVDFMIVNEVTKNVDGYRLSSYLYKDRDSRNPKIFAGPVWDFNLGFGNADYYEGWMTQGWQVEYLSNYNNMQWEFYLIPNWWKKLFNDESFSNKVYARWQNVKSSIYNTQHINTYIDSLTALLDEAKTRNFEKWPVLGVYVWPNPFVGQTYAEEINYLKSWIHDRLLWMDNNMIGEPTSILENKFERINEFKLYQNYPNPFNPNTMIEFNLIKASSTKLSLYDVLGRQVKILVNEFLEPGSYSFNYKAEGISSGIYFVKIESGNYQSTIKMVYDK